MHDPRIDRLAGILIDHSCQLQRGEKVLIEAFDLPDTALVCRLVELAAERGAQPFVEWKSNAVLRSLYKTGAEASLALAGQFERNRMEQMDAYIGIRGAANSSQFADVPPEQMDLYQRVWWHPVHSEVRVPKTRWVVLRYPTDSMAQAASMSSQAFEDYYFSVCTADYEQMARNQEPLVQRMKATDRVRISGPGTDLEFSIRGMNVRPCHGQRNIPDGEVFTAPIRDSVNGVIRYNTKSLYQGTVFDGIEFEFQQGKIIRATCTNEPARLNAILDSDEGARYIGEWSIGCNNAVRRPMLDTLFDEKIGGSIHLTPGNAYDECDNGNRSRVHWDLVLIQTPEYGGGEIHFDGRIIRRDGRFLPDDLQGLNAGF
ncbi:MAG: aminopeptidase [Pirellulales bacterium]